MEEFHMKIDGHIHSPYCPHGSNDTFVSYIETAISQSFTHISFTEHAPLPKGFDDPTPDKDSGMAPHLLPLYLQELRELKERYKDQITIQIGLEVDYIVGFEQETTAFLNEFGPYLDDAILSVHFLQFEGKYCCVDFSTEEFLSFSEKVGSVQGVYDLYYETVHKSIATDLGPYKPTRIGHPTLVHKFQLAHGEQIDDEQQVKAVLLAMAERNYTLDFNSAGLSKKYCQESYPPLSYLDFVKSIGLRYTFGSDAHTAHDLHQHYDKLMPTR